MKKINRYIGCVVLYIISTLTLIAQPSMERANEAYTNQEYVEAIAEYEAVAAELGTSATLYYNLGNAYFKNRDYAAAILNYERALLLEPNNEDTTFNLSIAQAHTVDKIEPLGGFFLALWLDKMINMYPSNTWAWVAIASFMLFVAAVLLYLFGRSVRFKKLGFFGAILLLIVSGCANRFAYLQKQEQVERNTAIIFAPTITVRSSPSESGTELFVLHEGTKVTVLEELSGWSEVVVIDGNRGWIPTDKLTII